MPGASVVIRGTTQGVSTGSEGTYSLRVTEGQVLQYRLLGYAAEERTVGSGNVINVQLRRTAINLDAIVTTALGETAQQRSVGVAQQTVQGVEIAETGRQNFVNALQGRVAGVEVSSSSGVPGASSSITIRGVSSISGSNQPLFVIDGLPMDNKTLNTNQLASDAPGSPTAFNNRGLDFTNRAADVNPEDIESLVVLKGPEATSLYGIDAANGAIVITTKRGRPGRGQLDYTNQFRMEATRARPETQRIYGPTSTAGGLLGSFSYFGPEYASGTQFYDNVDGFFRNALSQRHNMAFSGGAGDNSVNYRLTLSGDHNEGVIPTSAATRLNLNGFTQAQVTRWLRTDVSLQFSKYDNSQPFKGVNGPLIGLLVWPSTDQASDYLTPAGTRRRITNLAATGEIDNPYFAVNRNRIEQENSRLISNLAFILTPMSWGNVTARFGSDGYTNENLVVRHPESTFGINNNGIMDVANDVVQNLNSQILLNVNRRTYFDRKFSVGGKVGHIVQDNRSETDALAGQNFLDPNFVSINNTDPARRNGRTVKSQRRLMSVLGEANFAYQDFLFLNVTGRNDWTSTIPVERNSFFYPGVNGSFVLSEAVPAIGKVMTAKLRGAWAQAGKDARPYAYRPVLESKPTTGGGYGYGFTGPNLGLKPEFKISYEGGAELGFLDNRLSLDVTMYRAETRDQIVNDIRGSYGTGYILFNLNGALTRNTGTEVAIRATPVQRTAGSWDVAFNFDRSRGKTISLPNNLPESYVSDTWLYGNVRNGTQPGLSTRALTGTFYLRADSGAAKGQILIDPGTGLPIRSTPFINAGYDRQPNWTLGINNTVRLRRATLSFLVDLRRGGDVLNGTQHFLTTRGLSMQTLDRDQPRIVEGVLRDGRHNTANPTRNSIVVIPATQPEFYTSISEELFVEKDVNWLRLRDVRLSFGLPANWLRGRDASVYVQGTDLYLLTNYTGLDPIVNGNSAAVGGSGGAGIDFGNFPIPRGLSLGFRAGF